MPFRLPRRRCNGSCADCAGAHLYELSNKLALSKSDYFVVQGIYSGWWLVGLLLRNLPGILLGYCVRHTEMTPPTRSAPNSRSASSRPFQQRLGENARRLNTDRCDGVDFRNH